jgi:hypothetical protein
MNSWKVNGISGHMFRQAIINYFKLEPSSIYRAIKDVDSVNSIVTMYDGKKYKITLEEIKTKQK